MNIRAKYALLAAFIGLTLVMPMYAGSVQSTPRLTSSVRESTISGPNVAALEIMDSYVDPWGGVYNVVGGAYNASYYGFTHITALENIVKNQMQNDNGFVSLSVLELSGMTVFPNGVVGAPMAVLQIVVTPVIIVPTNRSQVHFADLTVAQAVSIAGEVAAVYNTALSISLQRLMTVNASTSFIFDYDLSPHVHCYGHQYYVTYVALLTAAQGLTSMNALMTRLASLGGFMSILAAPSWPDLYTTAVEAYMPFHYMPHYDSYGNFVLEMFGGVNKPYVKSADVNDAEVVQSLVDAGAYFSIPGYVTAVAGNETYSLKTHVGYTGNIENKMQQVSSANSISVIGGEAPASLTMYGIPSSWITVNDQFKLPSEVDIGPITIPENSTISDAIRMVLSYLPREAALSVNSGLGSIDNTMFDAIVDHVWNVTKAWPDFRQVLLTGVNYTISTPLVEMNNDLLASMMRRAGMTPDTLISKIDPTLAAKSPLGALVKAFVSYFDAYHVLDILEPDNYATAPGMAGYLNTLIDGVEKVLHDLGGLDVTTTFKTKEGIATFVQEHWGITLQALWTAMAANDLYGVSGVKAAFHAMLNGTNLQKHITPYLMADLGASLISGIGFQFALNYNGTAFLPISANDLSLSFDVDLVPGITGPYLAVVKGVSTRTVTSGQNVTYTINVHNYGDATAYDVKVLDGICAGLDGDRPYYWTKSSLAAGATWEFTYQVKTSEAGLYMDMPAICVYFNQSLSTFDPAHAVNWTGSARYTMSAFGYQINVEGAGGWLPSTLFGIPTLYVIAGVGGVAVLGVALLVIRRRA
jgi:uncharacterized repeat protein (TIGR01451 family)